MSEPAIPVTAIVSIVAISLAIVRELLSRKKDIRRLLRRCTDEDIKKIEFIDLF